MRRDPRAYLWDLAQATAAIRLFTTAKTLEDYLGNELLRSAVERKFSIISEALAQLLRHFPDYRQRITMVGEIIVFRNQVVHGYATLRDDLVWEIVQQYLPILAAQVAELLEADPPRED